jgi:hypothetical protein
LSIAEKRTIRARCIAECVMTEQAAFEAPLITGILRAAPERRKRRKINHEDSTKIRRIRRKSSKSSKSSKILRVLRFFVVDVYSFNCVIALTNRKYSLLTRLDCVNKISSF